MSNLWITKYENVTPFTVYGIRQGMSKLMVLTRRHQGWIVHSNLDNRNVCTALQCSPLLIPRVHQPYSKGFLPVYIYIMCSISSENIAPMPVSMDLPFLSLQVST